MRVRIIARFKNEEFYYARLEAGLTQEELAIACGMPKNGAIRINGWENFRGYPWLGKRGHRDTKEYAANLERLLHRPYDVLFPQEYRDAVDRKLGRPIQGVMEFKELPEWQGRNLMLPGPEETYDMVELRKAVRQSLDLLGEQEKFVLERRFGLDGMEEGTFEEIANEMDITRERVRQIQEKALRKLKHPSRNREIKGFSKER